MPLNKKYLRRQINETFKGSKHELLATLVARYVMWYCINNTCVVPMVTKRLRK